MSFDTHTFWIFFPLVWILWRVLPFAAAKGAMLLASLAFYAWWNPWFLTLITTSACIDYVAGARIHRATDPRGRRAWLAFSLATNLGLLAVFKYTPFLLDNADWLAARVGLGALPRPASWILPVGISFYTFQSLSYTIDVYRRSLTPVASFRDFFLYVAFFPQLVAGPIVRAQEFLPQLRRRRRVLPKAVQTGLYFVICGLCLKVVVADNLAPAVERVFALERLRELSPVATWLGVVYFGVQIFADFAGYSGIAIGLAYLMGLRFPLNFRYPYIAGGLSEFWTRWHVSLSQWLRDYLYVPLGGNRRGQLLTYRNLLVTMLLGGLWHGAAWTYVAWGALHGVGLCVERALGGRAPAPSRPRGVPALCGRLARIALTFVFVHTAWVFFRAPTFEMARVMLGRMYVAPFREGLGLEDLMQARHLVLTLPVFALHAGQLAHEWFGLEKTPARRAVVAAVALFLLTVVARPARTPFLYIQF